MIFVLDEEPRSGGRHAAMGGGGEDGGKASVRSVSASQRILFKGCHLGRYCKWRYDGRRCGTRLIPTRRSGSLRRLRRPSRPLPSSANKSGANSFCSSRDCCPSSATTASPFWTWARAPAPHRAQF